MAYLHPRYQGQEPPGFAGRFIWNDNPRPYVWIRTADQILAASANYCSKLVTHNARRPRPGAGAAARSDNATACR
ncbi:hypothetical protein BST44_25770 [Mycobacterium scrofulaceum]|uniref:Uncharacterized protein n=2 Tax=Mycobacterium TaxID=1763 RepID=A0A557XWW5_9MYCO|nr:hypothetical protein BS641_03955 [Mycobacterium avium subsp. hominissuis]ARV80723.1 hypothetical protein BWK49_04990 [Mycobacterium intracellulare subsp. chimaera]ORB69313.1 hypothetical protein BST44_25770 [Mycobacterium scrofulaceum]QNI13825.1 hypothetical protein GAN18_24350 [Mycobacterium kubicae]TVS86443.1 hypothetical protein FPZ46_11410 [Mycobacterium helveticum]